VSFGKCGESRQEHVERLGVTLTLGRLDLAWRLRMSAS
jgi:hypothetical protein